MNRKPVKVLFDSNVVRYGAFWRPIINPLAPNDTPTVYNSTKLHSKNKLDTMQSEIALIPHIAILVTEGKIAPYLTIELRCQIWSQLSFEKLHSNAFKYNNWVDLPLPFRSERLLFGPPHYREAINNAMKAVREYKGDPLYLQMLALSGMEKKKDDIFHLYTAEKGEMDYFLTMDRTFVATTNKLKQCKLKTKAVLPSSLIESIQNQQTILS